MSASNSPDLAFPKGRPRDLERHDKQQAAEEALADAYKAVDARDRRICQVTGILLSPGSPDPAKALTRDHLAARGPHPDKVDDPDNILTVSLQVHRLRQAHAILVWDAGGCETTHVHRIAKFAWNRKLVAPGKEPFRLRTPKRRVA